MYDKIELLKNRGYFMDISVSNPRRRFGIAAILLSLLALIQFLIYYTVMGFFYESTALILTAQHLTNFLEAFAPPISALVVFLLKSPGVKNKIIPTFLISLTRIIYTFPYYYVYYVSDVFNTSEAIVLSVLVSIVYILFFFLLTFVCILVLNHSESRANSSNAKRERSKLFDLGNHINFGILLSVILMFVMFFIRELANTVSFFTEVGSDYYADEILTLVLAYVILPISAFLHYSLCVLAKNRIIDKTEDADN